VRPRLAAELPLSWTLGTEYRRVAESCQYARWAFLGSAAPSSGHGASWTYFLDNAERAEFAAMVFHVLQ
jgi:hypothetical protein